MVPLTTIMAKEEGEEEEARLRFEIFRLGYHG
jgi:hypothetical protein